MKKFKKSLISTLLIINILITSNITALAGTWPSERHDPNNSAFINEKIFPSFKEKSSTYFSGYAPVYANKTIYYNDGYKIYTYNLTNGKLKWNPIENPNSSLSPTIDGNYLYFGDASGNLWAVEDNDTPVVKWKKTAISTMNPVLVTENFVIVNGSEEKNNKVMAFDKATGTKLWEQNLHKNILEPSKGIGAPIRDGSNVIVATENNLYCFNIFNGNKIWGPVDIKKEEYTQNGYPVLAGNNVIIKTPQNDVKAFDKTNGTLKWTAAFPSVPVKTGAVWGNNIYFLTDNGILTALNINDGSQVWEPLDLNKDGAAYAFNTPPIIAGRILYFASQDGTIFAVEAERGYLWHHQQITVSDSVDEYPLNMIAADGMLIMSTGINGYKILEHDIYAADTIKPLIYDEKKSVGVDMKITAVIEDNLEGGINPESISLSVDGKAVSKQSITYDQSTKLMTASIDGFTKGNHQAVLSVSDMSNNQNNLTWGFYQDSDVPQINFSSLESSDVFINTGSTINFNFQLSEDSNITAKILDDNNNIIKTLLVHEGKEAGSVNIIWDGKDQAGNIVGNGGYHLEVTTTDNSNNTAVAVTPNVNIHQKIDNFLSNLTTSKTKLIIDKDNQVDIFYNLAQDAQIKLVIADSSGNIVRNLFNGPKKVPSDLSAIQQSWDLKDDLGKPVPVGNYSVRIMGTDDLGNGFELKTNLSLNKINYNLVTDLNINPDPFILGGTNKADISYNLAADSVVNVNITDSQGGVVANLLKDANQMAGIIKLPLWDGNNLEGNKLPKGEYILNIEATAKNGDINLYNKNFSLDQVGDDYEFNDSLTRAREITTGETIGTINPQGDVDYYKINVPRNRALNVLLQPHKDMDGQVEIYNEKMNLVSFSNTHKYEGVEKAGVFSKGEIFYIKVSDVDTSFSEAQYTLNTSIVTGDSWELNEAGKKTYTLTKNKSIFNRTLEYYGDYDQYSYVANSAGKVTVKFIAPSLNGVIKVTNKKTGKTSIVNNVLQGEIERYAFPVQPNDSLVFSVEDLAGDKSDENYTFSFNFVEGPLKISHVKAASKYSLTSGKKHNINFTLSKAASAKIDIYDSRKKLALSKKMTLKKGGPTGYSWNYTGSKKVLAKKPTGKYTFVITAKDKKKTVVSKGSFTVKK